MDKTDYTGSSQRIWAAGGPTRRAGTAFRHEWRRKASCHRRADLLMAPSVHRVEDGHLDAPTRSSGTRTSGGTFERRPEELSWPATDSATKADSCTSDWAPARSHGRGNPTCWPRATSTGPGWGPAWRIWPDAGRLAGGLPPPTTKACSPTASDARSRRRSTRLHQPGPPAGRGHAGCAGRPAVRALTVMTARFGRTCRPARAPGSVAG